MADAASFCQSGYSISMDSSGQMTSLNISLPETMRAFIQEQINTGGYSTASEYVRQLIRAAQKRAADQRLEALLLEGLDSEAHEMTREDWDDIRLAVQEGLARRRGDARKNRSA
jgi:antitoxin ParD1/3/4